MTSVGDKPDNNLNRALPGRYIDMIRGGIPGDYNDMWSGLISIAMSAQQRGWNETEYITAISNTSYIHVDIDKHSKARRKTRHPSRLWKQVLDQGGGRRRTDLAGIATLGRAWRRGQDYLDGGGKGSTEHARVRAIRWIDRLDSDADALTIRERAVMTYVIGQTGERGWPRAACPCREVGEAAKMPWRSALRTLASLTERGLLIRHSPGSRRTRRDPEGRSAIYELADPDRLRDGGRGSGTYKPRRLICATSDNADTASDGAAG